MGVTDRHHLNVSRLRGSPLCALFVSFGIQGIQIDWREAKIIVFFYVLANQGEIIQGELIQAKIIWGHRPTPFECTGQSMRGKYRER